MIEARCLKVICRLSEYRRQTKGFTAETVWFFFRKIFRWVAREHLADCRKGYFAGRYCVIFYDFMHAFRITFALYGFFRQIFIRRYKK